MNDYNGGISYFQNQLDRENINFDMSAYIGCTARELQSIVDSLINNGGELK